MTTVILVLAAVAIVALFLLARRRGGRTFGDPAAGADARRSKHEAEGLSDSARAHRHIDGGMGGMGGF